MAKVRKPFEGLRRYRKRLLAPFSAAFAKHERKITNVSWTDDGAAELLWVCCLVQKFGFDRVLPVVSAIAALVREKPMEQRAATLFLSRMATLEKRDFQTIIFNLQDVDMARSVEHYLIFFLSVIGEERRVPRSSKADFADIVPDLRSVVRLATNKENAVALKAMALFLKCEIESDRLVVPASYLETIDPYSLDDYPNSLRSKMTAGLLRAHMNGMLMTPSERGGAPYCEKLWPFLIALDDCR